MFWFRVFLSGRSAPSRFLFGCFLRGGIICGGELDLSRLRRDDWIWTERLCFFASERSESLMLYRFVSCCV